MGEIQKNEISSIETSKRPHQVVKQSVNNKQPIELDEEIYRYNSFQFPNLN